MMTLAEKLKSLRTSKGAKLRDVEAATGISNAYLSQLETGKISNPSIRIVKALESYYGRDLDAVKPDGATARRPNAAEILARLKIAREQIRRAMELDMSLFKEPHSLLDVEHKIVAVEMAIFAEGESEQGE